MIWLTLLIVFGLIPTLMAGAKKAAASRGVGTDNSDEFSEADDNEADDFFSFDEDEPKQTVAQQPGYFTYEDPNVDISSVKPAVQQPVVIPAVEEQPAASAFDLRQAVIYQTLLNNKYINAEI